MKTILAMAFCLLLVGCASYDTLQGNVAHDGARVADEVRETAEWTLCNGITVGAWRRAYAANPVKATGWRDLCKQPPAETP